MKKIFEEPIIECITLQTESITDQVEGSAGGTLLPDGWDS